jgi:uncharacterized protein (TIGR00730 family)
MRSIARVCVFCGSSPGRDPRYAAAARDLADILVTRGIGLVYGGASVGLMGALADRMLELGGEVTGVIPEHLVGYEVAHRGLSDLIVVGSMHERKAAMAERSDAFIALPGGFGTLEEAFESITWTQLGLQNKPVGFLDVADFFAHLRTFIDQLVDQRFVAPEHREQVVFDDEPGRLLDRLARAELLPLEKWLDRPPPPV